MKKNKKTPHRKIEISKQESIMLYEALREYLNKLHRLDIKQGLGFSFGRELAEIAIRKENEIIKLIEKVISESEINEHSEIEYQANEKFVDSGLIPF